MGEATYYFVAKFDNKENAKHGMDKIKQYLEEQKKAYDYLETHESKDVYTEILKLYPLALSFLDKKKIENEDDKSDSLARFLIDTQEPFSECLDVDKNLVIYHQEVWHLDNWDHLVRFAKSLKGCLKATYKSDEYADSEIFESLIDEIK